MKNSEKRLPLLHLALLLAGSVFLLSGAFHANVWFDECYSVMLAQQDLSVFFHAAYFDVHPYFYYLTLRVVYLLGGGVVAMRVYSAFLAVLLAWLGFTHIRKDFGGKVGFWFSFFAVSLPCIFKYALQIRMYSLATLLVMLTAIYAYRYIKNGQRRFDLILFALFAVLAAYTHYFALFAICAVNFAFLLTALWQKMPAKPVIWCAVSEILCYIPGLVIAIHQAMTGGAAGIRVEYPDALIDTVGFPFIGDMWRDIPNVGQTEYAILTVLSFVFLLFCLVMMVYKARREGCCAVAVPLLALGLYAGVIAGSLAASLLRPIYLQRYAVVMAGWLCLFFAFAMAAIPKIKVQAVTAVLFLAVCFTRAGQIYQTNYTKDENPILQTMEETIGKEDIILFDTICGYIFTVLYPENETYFYEINHWNVEDAYMAFGSASHVVNNMDFLDDFTGRIWVVNTDAAYRDAQAHGFSATKEGETALTGEVYLSYYGYRFTLSLLTRNSDSVIDNSDSDKSEIPTKAGAEQ